MLRICRICGAEFEAKGTRSVCYADHYHACPICGKPVLCNDPLRQTCTCSRACGAIQANAARSQTMQAKYGVDNPSHIPEVQAKISASLKAARPKAEPRYKSCEVCGRQFQLIWPYTQHTCSPKCRGVYRKQTGIAHQAFEKSQITNLCKYGVPNQGMRSEVQQQMRDTMEARYGVRYARYLPEVEAKVQATCLERYGAPYYIQTETANQNNHIRISKLNQDFGTLLAQNGIDHSFELYLDSKFFDICIPDLRIVIEIDPTYSHSAIGNHWRAQGLPSTYHIDKSQLAQKYGYRCIHVFDWDDWHKILQLLLPKKHIYARICTVQSVDKATADSFTAMNHIAGKCQGQHLNYGLYDSAMQLLMVMTFGRPRYTQKYDLELLRLCSRVDVQVLGGANKLFYQFRKDHPVESVISYCDLSKFTGAVYPQLGMALDHVSAPAKIWSKGQQKITDNLLRQRGFDQLFHTSFGKGTSNEALMLEHNWLPIYDCGQAVYTSLAGFGE